MSRWTRRDLLRAAGASAAVVPAATLGGRGVLAATGRPQPASEEPTLEPTEAAAVTAEGPLMVCVHDAAAGNFSILHGTDEIVVSDPRLVAKIVRARKAGAK